MDWAPCNQRVAVEMDEIKHATDELATHKHTSSG